MSKKMSLSIDCYGHLCMGVSGPASLTEDFEYFGIKDNLRGLPRSWSPILPLQDYFLPIKRSCKWTDR